MKAHSVDRTNTGQSTAVRLDIKAPVFNVGLAAVISGGPTYSVEYTLDDTNWYAVSGLSGATANAAAALTIPAKAVRINITAVVAATDSVTLTVIQAGDRG